MAVVLLANAPDFVLKKLTGKRWVYFGNNEEIAQRLRRTLSGESEIDYSREIYAVSEKNRYDFAGWIDGISMTGPKVLEWFISVPATKNPYFSDLFLNICYVLTARELLKRSDAPEVWVVDSSSVVRVLAQDSEHFNTHLWNTLGMPQQAMLTFLKVMAKWGLFIVQSVRVWLAAKIVLGARARKLFAEIKPTVLVRNYISKDFIESGQGLFERHFFPGLSGYLQKNGKSPVYLSIPVNVRSYGKLFRAIKKSPLPVVVPDEFLTWSDFWEGISAPVRTFFYDIKPAPFNGVEAAWLVDEDLITHVSDQSVLNGIMFSRLGLRLRAAGLNCDSIINWSEFQSFEKGLIAGIREAYPEAELIGSQPFCVPENHLSLFPSRQDHIFKLIPDKMLVLGPVHQAVVQRFLPEANVDFSPAFRYQKLFEKSAVNAEANDLIVLFGYGLSNALFVLRTLIELKDRMPPFRRVLIKLHPATYFKKKRLIAMVGLPVPDNFIFAAGSLEESLTDAAVGICGATGTAVELAARGIPVVVAAEKRAVTMHYLPSMEHHDLWKLCFSPAEILASLEYFYQKRKTNAAQLMRSAEKFKQTYFVSQEDRLWENYCAPRKEGFHHAV